MWGLACAILLAILLLMTVAILRARAQAADLRRGIETQRSTLARLQRDETLYSGVLAKPNNADVFSRNVFLNEVIARRAVSWTLVFRDLEHLLPSNVRLIGVRLPQVAAEEGLGKGSNKVQLDMQLGSDKPEAIIEVLKRLSDSKMFGAARMLAEQPPNQNDPFYKFRITVAYAQEL